MTCCWRCPKTKQLPRRKESSRQREGLSKDDGGPFGMHGAPEKGTARARAWCTPGRWDAVGFLSGGFAGVSSPSCHPQHREPLESHGGSADRNHSGTGPSCKRRHHQAGRQPGERKRNGVCTVSPGGLQLRFLRQGDAYDGIWASASVPQLYLISAASKTPSSCKPPGNSKYNNRGDEGEAKAHAQPQYQAPVNPPTRKRGLTARRAFCPPRSHCQP